MEEDRLVADTHDLEYQAVSMRIARGELRYEIEIPPVAIPLDAEGPQTYRLGHVKLLLFFEFRAIRCNSVGYELLALPR
jgi:hypothetical protein